MIPGIEANYQIIADEMVKYLPGPWKYAKIDAVYYPEGSDYPGEFVTGLGHERSFRVTRRAVDAFDDLRQKFRDAGHRVWGQVTFELHPDGAFNVKWGDDNCDENGDTIWNPEEWSRQDQERHDRLTKS